MSAPELVASLAASGLSVACAESLTGGQVSAAIVDVPGASKVFRGAVVAYATDLKASVLGVEAGLLAERGPVDPTVALEMAAGVRRLLEADIGLATTGVAGPGPCDGAAAGTAYIAVDAGHGLVEVIELRCSGSRSQVRAQVTLAALELAERIVAALAADIGRSTR